MCIRDSTYAVPTTSVDMYNRIRAAKIGIIFHTSYSGKTMRGLKASFGASVGGLRQKKNVFFDDARYKQAEDPGFSDSEEKAFDNIIKIWKSDSLLSQAWDDSISMLKLSHDVFIKSLESFNSNDTKEEVKALKREDKKINDFQMTVRRKVLTHFSLDTNSREVPNGLFL